MKRAVIFLLLVIFVITAASQPKSRGRVKRKYRDVEQVSQNLPQVVFRGLVRDIYKTPIPGACVEIEGLKHLVHSNEFGGFMLSDLPAGRLRIRISCIGYRTKTIDYMLQEGFNDHYIALDQERVHLEALISSSQKRDQHIPDIPSALAVVNKNMTMNYAFAGNPEIAGLIPEMNYIEQGAGNAGFSIRGINGNAGFVDLFPSIAVFADEVPLIQPGGIFPLYFDMERVEVLNGPQNTLFGSYALGGALHYKSIKPENNPNGYIHAGGGNFSAREVMGAVNLPLLKNILFIRTAGLYMHNNGYVENTLGGTLNGTENYGGRLSLRFLPADNHTIDLKFDYYNSIFSGTGFINPWFTGESDEALVFNDIVSLNRGEELGSRQKTMNWIFTYRYFFNEHNYLTLISSYRKLQSLDVTDDDGTNLPAFETDNKRNAGLFYNEIRYNFTRKSRLNGSAGLIYSVENNTRRQSVISNDQFIYEIIKSPGNFTLPDETRLPFSPNPLNLFPETGIPTGGLHFEENLNDHASRSAQLYSHFTYRLNQTLFFNGGARAFYDRMQLNYESLFTGGTASSLGQFGNSAPNLLFQPAAEQEISQKILSFTGEAGFTYRWNQNFNLFIKAAKGSSPQKLIYSRNGESKIIDAVKMNSLEGGMKTTIRQNLFLDVTGFFYKHLNVQAINWADSDNSALLDGNGKATSFGLEARLKAAIVRGLNFFGNYAWLQSAYDSTGVDGNLYPYAGKNFPFAPEHSFSTGLTARAEIAKDIRVFVSPWYSWQSHFWFTETNSPGLAQNAYGLLNVKAGIELRNPALVISVLGTNVTDEKYLSSSGSWGGINGIPAVVRGTPRMMKATVLWKF